jgi:bacterial/archaeal transporter family-2 protein
MLIAVQGPINATLARAIGSSVNAALVSFLVGTLALVAVALGQRTTPDMGLVRALPWWAWSGGLCGAVFVAGAAFAAPRIGVANMLTVSVASQLITAMLLDHWGAFGVPVQSISATRVAGILLVVAGAVLVRRG